jgi:tellurite resistance protein
MRNLFTLLFGRRVTGKPIHTEIERKTNAIIAGCDEVSQEVHKKKNQTTVDWGEIQQQARAVKREADKLNRVIDTAYMIAKATGNI